MEMRILRDQNPSRSIVLIRFREEGDKDKFRREFEARKYWESKDVSPPSSSLSGSRS